MKEKLAELSSSILTFIGGFLYLCLMIIVLTIAGFCKLIVLAWEN